MAFIKKSETGDIKKEVEATVDFPARSKYSMGGQIFLVKEAFSSDNVEWRRVANIVNGDDSIIMLKTLQEDLKDGIITLGSFEKEEKPKKDKKNKS